MAPRDLGCLTPVLALAVPAGAWLAVWLVGMVGRLANLW